jgi:hypothetical protein
VPFDSEAKLRDVGKKNLLPDTHTKKKVLESPLLHIYIYIYIYIHTYHIYIYVCTHISYRYIDIYIYILYMDRKRQPEQCPVPNGWNNSTKRRLVFKRKHGPSLHISSIVLQTKLYESKYILLRCRTEWSLTGLKIKSLRLSFCAASIMADRTPLRWNPRCRCFGVISNSI